MNSYLGIEFAKDYNESFAEFKDRFGSNHIFNNFPPKQREQELKKAYQIATYRNGNTSGTIKKIEKNPAETTGE